MAAKPAIEETQRDKDAWARLWALVRSPWERDQDLADFLGISRPSVIAYASGAGRGSWPALRAALRETGRRYPEAMPRIMQALALELFDLRGIWVSEDSGSGDFHEELGEGMTALGDLARDMKGGDPEEIIEGAQEAVREVTQVAMVAIGSARARQGLELVQRKRGSA